MLTDELNKFLEVDDTSDTDEKVKKAIIELMDLKTPNQKDVFHFKMQWQAVYRILVDYYGYPKDYLGFYNKIKSMGLDHLRVPCQYYYLSHISGILAKSFTLWNFSKFSGSRYAYQHYYNVAMALISLLHISI